ncbi:MAG TPA: hypothetical protein VFO55_01245 [Gemmatimonadaceae bacterium]|nr:hypothetical protein [Gemmatimonadaceae bacterium]
MMTRRSLAALRMTAGLALAARSLGAQAMPSTIETKIAVRKLGPVVRGSAITFGGVQHVRRLSDGRLLVNDPSRRQVLLLDSTLANPVVVIDSVGGRDDSYGLRAGGIVPYRGDSTFFVDPTSSTLLLIDPAGRIAKVLSMPTNAVSYLSSPNSYGYPGFSEAFGLVFRMPSSSFRYPGQMPPEGAPEIVVRYEDSVAVVGMKLSTRRGDTIVKYGTGQVQTMRISYNNFRSDGRNELWPTTDDWAMMADGSIALLSGREYRVRFINPDGTKSEPPRLPFAWVHNPDAEKTRIADSINAVREKNYQERVAAYDRAQAAAKSGTAPPPRPGPAGEFRPPPGPSRPPTRPDMVTMTDVPDYFPAYEKSSNTFRADEDNNLWIRPRPGARQAGGGQVYDIVNRKGELTDRVQLPPGRTLIGFGPGGIVYLLARDAGAVRVEEARVR